MKKLVITCIMMSTAFCAYAAEESSGQAAAHRLDPIIVTATRAPEGEAGSALGTSVLTSSKSADVITAVDIDRSGARTVPDVLKGHVGIDVKEYLGNGKTAQVDIRGFGETAMSNVLVMIDGRRTNQNDISGTDWLQIDPDSIERIEVLRGPQSVLYGDNAAAGVVNIITKRGAGKKPEIGGSYETGSYHYNSYGGHALGGSDFLDYAVFIKSAHTDGYRNNSDLETTDFTNTCTLKPTDYCRIRFDAGYHKDWYGMPGTVTDVQIDRDGWRAVNTPDDCGRTEDSYCLWGIDILGQDRLAGNSFTTDITLRQRRTAAANFLGGNWYETNSHIRTFGVTPRVNLEGNIVGRPNRLVFGADYYRYNDGITGSNWVNLIFGDGRQKDLINIEEQTFGIYAEDTLELLPRLTVNGGARGEWAGYSFEQEYIARASSDKRSFEYAFDAGVNYQYNDSSAVYASIARSFRLPAVDEWYQNTISFFGTLSGGLNLDLEPQTGMNYEIGVREHTLKWLKIDADYFLMDTRHELYYDPINFVNMLYDRTRRHGLELETHILPVEDFDLYARYTYEKAFFVGSHYAGNTVPMVPRHKLSWGIAYTFMDCVDVDYVFYFVGPRRFVSDMQNTNRQLKQYITSDLRIAYRKHGFEVFGVLNNILDHHYADIGSWGQYYPANGRNFLFGVKQKF